MPEEKLIEGTDFYFDDNGLMILTAAYLLKRGTCCQNGCRHCPYGFKPYATLLNDFLQSHGPVDCQGWGCVAHKGVYAWDAPVFENGETVVAMFGPHSSYVECYLTIIWAKAKIHFTQQDTKTEAMNNAWDVSLTEEQLKVFKAALWPAPLIDRGPWF